MSEQRDREYLQVLAANGMKISLLPENVAKELKRIGETMTEEWIKTAGPDGQRIIDAYRKKP